MPETLVRPITAQDRSRWEPLWAGYLKFYSKRLAPEVTEFTWQRLAAGNGIEGFLAVDPQGQGVGLVHFMYHTSAHSLGDNCYLQDLFVEPTARGGGIGVALIQAVAAAAREKKAALVYWQTEEFNGTARRVYERVAKRVPFIRYNLEL